MSSEVGEAAWISDWRLRRRFGNGKAASLVAVNAHGHGVVFTGSRQREATRRGLGEPAVAVLLVQQSSSFLLLSARSPRVLLFQFAAPALDFESDGRGEMMKLCNDG
ncbi:hypothetical protein M0R45_034630 [Rubus argutus]